MLGALLIVALGLAFAAGGAATYVWLSETEAWSVLASHAWPVVCVALLAVLLTLGNLGLRWLRWNFLLRRFHVRIATRDTFRVFFGTLAAIMTPLYLGELLRGAVIARQQPALRSVVLWVWLVERASDVAALVLIWGLFTGSVPLAGIGLVFLCVAPWALSRATLRAPEAQSLHTGQLHTASVVGLCAAMSLGAWLLPVFALYAVALAVGVDASLSLASQAFCEGTLLGGLSGSPGGLGTTGSAMILVSNEAGVALSRATASVLILRFATQWFATALGVVLAVVWRKPLVRLLRSECHSQQHFDALAPTYAEDIPEHYRVRILRRKITAMLPHLPAAGADVRGLDLGCGQGWYAADLAERGYSMHGVDLSSGQIGEARRYCQSQSVQVDLRVYDGEHLPYEDGTFDFAYSINVLHHVINPDAQRRLLAEALRVLKPGGLFMLHEMNVENALFRGYVSYVFPLLKSIDEGTELWIRPSRLPRVAGGKWKPEIAYFTFLPEFLPDVLLRSLQPVERWLESSPVLRKYSAHYMATLQHG